MRYRISSFNTTTYEDGSESMTARFLPVRETEREWESLSMSMIAVRPQGGFSLEITDDETKEMIRSHVGKEIDIALKVVGE